MGQPLDSAPRFPRASARVARALRGLSLPFVGSPWWDYKVGFGRSRGVGSLCPGAVRARGSARVSALSRVLPVRVRLLGSNARGVLAFLCPCAVRARFCCSSARAEFFSFMPGVKGCRPRGTCENNCAVSTRRGKR